MSDSDEMGFIRPALQPIPPDRSGIEWRVPENQGAAPPPAPAWGFNERKLLTLIEAAEQAHLLRRHLSEKVREARSKLARLRIAAEAETRSYGSPHWTTKGAMDAAEQELQRLVEEQEILNAKTDSTIRTAAACEQWARSQGWTPDGHRGVTPPPQVGPEDPAPMLAGWKR